MSRKHTENQIVKWLEERWCPTYTNKSALDLINSQQAEIARLKAENEAMLSELWGDK